MQDNVPHEQTTIGAVIQKTKDGLVLTEFESLLLRSAMVLSWLYQYKECDADGRT